MSFTFLDKTYPISKLSYKQIIPQNALLYPYLLYQNNTKKTLEIHPVNTCNHHCLWCNSTDYNNKKINEKDLYETINDFHFNGGTAIHFSGGGEPLLYEPLYRNNMGYKKSILEFCTDLGIYTGIITNGVFLDKIIPHINLPYLSFIRISLDATDSISHSKRHGTDKSDFDKIRNNIYTIIKRRENNCLPAIGISIILDDSDIFCNYNSIKDLNALTTYLNIDFLQIKHEYTNNEQLANERLMLFNKISKEFCWGNIELWIQKLTKNHLTNCMVKNIMSLYSYDGLRTCCYSNIINNYNCNNISCRYLSVNTLLTEIYDKNFENYNNEIYNTNIEILKNSLENDGFHPYRLYPSAPELISISGYALDEPVRQHAQ